MASKEAASGPVVPEEASGPVVPEEASRRESTSQLSLLNLWRLLGLWLESYFASVETLRGGPAPGELDHQQLHQVLEHLRLSLKVGRLGLW